METMVMSDVVLRYINTNEENNSEYNLRTQNTNEFYIII